MSLLTDEIQVLIAISVIFGLAFLITKLFKLDKQEVSNRNKKDFAEKLVEEICQKQ